MTQLHNTTTQRPRGRLVFLLTVIGAAILFAAPAFARPPNLDRSLNRVTDHGVFHVQLESTRRPIPLWRVHQWTARVTDASGQPVSGATVVVGGGMPDHRHGLPTAPRASATTAPGGYVIDGVKFSMPGWWVLTLAVRGPDGRSDTVTFNLIL